MKIKLDDFELGKYTEGDVVVVDNCPRVIWIITGKYIYLRHMNTFEWLGYKFRQLFGRKGG